MQPFLKIFSLVLFSWLAIANYSAQALTYSTGEPLLRDITKELRKTLSPRDLQMFPEDCLIITEDATPWVKPIALKKGDRNEPGRYVAVSRGFIDLMNHVSHAKGIDKYEAGYFADYLKQLARETGRFPLQSPEGVFDPEFWRDEIMNEQASNFNQMTAMIIAIHLAHHTLGHYDELRFALDDPNSPGTPINDLLRPSEWQEAFDAGMEIALAAGYGTEGFEALCEALDQMPRRPWWTIYLLPVRFDMADLEEQMHEAEGEFFLEFVPN